MARACRWCRAARGARRQLTRYVILPPAGDTAVSLWALHTHVFEASPITPRLQIKSPEPRCGKTSDGDPRSLSPQVAEGREHHRGGPFRTVETARPTLIIDEADTFIVESEELRGILNTGHSRGGEVIRTVGEDFEPQAVLDLAPVAIAAIGKIPHTLEDRAIRIEMKRRARGEPVERWRADRAHLLLGDVIAVCAMGPIIWTSCGRLIPLCPISSRSRRDNWRPCSLLPTWSVACGPSGLVKPQRRSRLATMPIRAAPCCWRHQDDIWQRGTRNGSRPPRSSGRWSIWTSGHGPRSGEATSRSRCKGCARCSSPSRCSRHTTLKRPCAAIAWTDSPIHGRGICLQSL